MTEVDIVKKVCEIMGLEYSHYDNHEMGLDYFQHIKITSKPKIVVYSQEYSYWDFAILEDMSVLTSTSNYTKTLRSIYNRMLELGELTESQKEYASVLIDQENRIETAEEFLKDNNCSDVINDTNKKINWV